MSQLVKAKQNEMEEVAKKLSKMGSFAQRKLARKASLDRCLLLDVSASMHSTCSTKERRIEALRKVCMNFIGSKMFAFNTHTEEVNHNRIPDPMGGTDFTQAFSHVQKQGITSAFLITDGQDNNPHGALEFLRTNPMKLEIIYIGEGQIPTLLLQIAELCGGQATSGDISRDAEQIEDSIAGFLSAGDPADIEPKVFNL